MRGFATLCGHERWINPSQLYREVARAVGPAAPGGLVLAFTHKYPWTKERERKPYNFVLSEPQIAE